MKRWHVTWLVLLALATLFTVSRAAEMETMKQEAQTTHYRLQLQVGPMEQIFSNAEAAKKHPTSGEVMVSGHMAAMPMAGSMAMDQRHIEMHVISGKTGKVVKDAKVSITMTTDPSGKSVTVPIAAMYGVKEGPSDWHYGNNVSMPPGAYTVKVVVNGEEATFHVTIPKM